MNAYIFQVTTVDNQSTVKLTENGKSEPQCWGKFYFWSFFLSRIQTSQHVIAEVTTGGISLELSRSYLYTGKIEA